MECAIEQPVVDWARRNGWFVRKLKWIGRADAPDDVFAKGGRTLFIEFKDAGEPARLSQKREHDRMREAGMEIYLVDSYDDAIAILSQAE